MQITLGEAISILVALLSLGGWIVTYITKIAKIETRLAALDGVANRVLVLETKMGVFWRAVEETVPKQLIAPHSPRRDELLRLMTTHTLSVQEAQELEADLSTTLTQFPEFKQLSVILVIARLRQIMAEEELGKGYSIDR